MGLVTRDGYSNFSLTGTAAQVGARGPFSKIPPGSENSDPACGRRLRPRVRTRRYSAMIPRPERAGSGKPGT